MVNVGLLFSFFYIVVVSWSLWYLLVSFTTHLEWANCDHEYNTVDCFANRDDLNDTVKMEDNTPVSSAEEYWSRNVLGMQGKTWDNFVSNVI